MIFTDGQKGKNCYERLIIKKIKEAIMIRIKTVLRKILEELYILYINFLNAALDSTILRKVFKYEKIKRIGYKSID